MYTLAKHYLYFVHPRTGTNFLFFRGVWMGLVWVGGVLTGWWRDRWTGWGRRL